MGTPKHSLQLPFQQTNQSDFTSIQERLFELAKTRRNAHKPKPDHKSTPSTKLLPFVEAEHHTNSPRALPFNLKDYLELVDWTGRCVRDDKRGAIDQNRPCLLEQLSLSPEQWQLLAIDIQQHSLAALGSLEQREIYHASIDKRWMPKQAYLKRCY